MGLKAGPDVSEKRQNILPLPVTERRFLGRPGRSLGNIPSELSRLKSRQSSLFITENDLLPYYKIKMIRTHDH